jgi:hypothetical protein
MHKLTWADNNGIEWNCRVDLSTAKRLRDTGIDIFNPNGIAKLFSEVLETIEFLVELLRPQWEERGLSVLDVSDLLTGGDGVYASATNALSHGLQDFFRRLDRPALAMVIERAWGTAMQLETQSLENAGGQKVTTLMAEMLKKSQSEFDAKIAEEIAKLQKPGD